MGVIQFINTSPDEFIDKLDARWESKFDKLKNEYQPKQPTKYVSRQYVADEMLLCSLTTVHNLTVKGILKKFGCGGRVLYKRDQVEAAIVELKG